MSSCDIFIARKFHEISHHYIHALSQQPCMADNCLFTRTSINVFVASLYQSSSSFTPDCIMVTVCRQVNLGVHECCCTNGKRISIAFHIHGSHHLIRKEPTKHEQHIMHSNRCVSSVNHLLSRNNHRKSCNQYFTLQNLLGFASNSNL